MYGLGYGLAQGLGGAAQGFASGLMQQRKEQVAADTLANTQAFEREQQGAEFSHDTEMQTARIAAQKELNLDDNNFSIYSTGLQQSVELAKAGHGEAAKILYNNISKQVGRPESAQIEDFKITPEKKWEIHFEGGKAISFDPATGQGQDLPITYGAEPGTTAEIQSREKIARMEETGRNSREALKEGGPAGVNLKNIKDKLSIKQDTINSRLRPYRQFRQQNNMFMGKELPANVASMLGGDKDLGNDYMAAQQVRDTPGKYSKAQVDYARSALQDVDRMTQEIQDLEKQTSPAPGTAAATPAAAKPTSLAKARFVRDPKTGKGRIEAIK